MDDERRGEFLFKRSVISHVSFSFRFTRNVGEILFLNFSRRNVNFLLLHARKIEKKFCFETKFRLRRGSVAEVGHNCDSIST